MSYGTKITPPPPPVRNWLKQPQFWVLSLVVALALLPLFFFSGRDDVAAAQLDKPDHASVTKTTNQGIVLKLRKSDPKYNCQEFQIQWRQKHNTGNWATGYTTHCYQFYNNWWIHYLPPNTSYDIRVRHKSNSNVSDWIELEASTTVCCAPTGPWVSSVTRNAAKTEATVDWNYPMDYGHAVTHYQVEWRYWQESFYWGNWVPGYGASAELSASSGTSATITGLDANKHYEFRVRAKNKANWGHWGGARHTLPFGSAPGAHRTGGVSKRKIRRQFDLDRPHQYRLKPHSEVSGLSEQRILQMVESTLL